MSDEPRDPEVVPAKPQVSLPVPAATDRAVGPADALTAYMAELRRYPPISR